MSDSPILSCVVQVVREAALANGSSSAVTSSTCPASDVAGLDSPQLIHSTGEIARRLGLDIPAKENVFYDGRRPRTVDEIAARVATFTAAPSGDGSASCLPTLPIASSSHG